MRIVIAGAGEVGSHLAKLLSNEEQDILLIDENVEKLAQLDANYNIMTVDGNPASFRNLRELLRDGCDLFIAVTPSESTNVVACSIAKNLGATTTVARINHYGYMAPENRAPMKRMGVDHVIYPEYLAAQEIVTALEHPWTRYWFEFHDGAIILAGVKLRRGAPLIGMQLKEFAMTNHAFHVAAIKRHHESIIPRGDDRMMEGDILYITFTREHADDLRRLTGKTDFKVRRVVIMGGSKIAIRVYNLGHDRFKLKIIENDRDKCHALPEKCPDAEIVWGDARDPDVWGESDLDTADAFIALTPGAETNILACMAAKDRGVQRTVAEVENLQFVALAEGMNIGKVINKKLLAGSGIFQLLLDADASTAKCLALSDAEVAELEVKKGSRITESPVKDLKLPRSMTLAALIRNGEGMLIGGNTHIQAGDRVLVFFLQGAIHKVERLFS
ncbi:MAG: Trk system potassium transporter TrkA [Muribaculaceae bacterium]|nr:Trk system potassium transporter TrkA [Muribaculaceae bacterium]